MKHRKKERLPSVVAPESPKSETDYNVTESSHPSQQKQAYKSLSIPNDGFADGERPAPRRGIHLSYAERCYLEICENESGDSIDDEQFVNSQGQRNLLKMQSIQIADLLESQGITAYGTSNLTIVGLLTGKVEQLIDFRNIVFIPSIAASKRRGILKQLEYFVSNNPYSRMWVFTAGQRTKITDVRETISQSHRRISKLNNQAFMKASGVSIAFRSTELGSMQRIKGESTFHVHIHAIIHLERRLEKEQWSHLLKRVRSWWKYHFSDSQKINQAREACKYCVKPGDLINLTGEELAQLYKQMFKLHLVQCLGPLKLQRKIFKDQDVKPRKMGEHWRLLPNWNAGRGKKPKSNAKIKPTNSLVCTLPPAPYLSTLKEPAVIVMNYDKEKSLKQARIARARQAALGQMRARIPQE